MASTATTTIDGEALACMALPRWMAIRSATPTASKTCRRRTPCSPRNRARDTSQKPLQVAEPPIATDQLTHAGASPIQGDIKDSASDPLTTANRTSASRLARRSSKMNNDNSDIATAAAVIAIATSCIAVSPERLSGNVSRQTGLPQPLRPLNDA